MTANGLGLNFYIQNYIMKFVNTSNPCKIKCLRTPICQIITFSDLICLRAFELGLIFPQLPQTSLAKAVSTPDKFLDSPLECHCSKNFLTVFLQTNGSFLCWLQAYKCILAERQSIIYDEETTKQYQQNGGFLLRFWQQKISDQFGTIILTHQNYSKIS